MSVSEDSSAVFSNPLSLLKHEIGHKNNPHATNGSKSYLCLSVVNYSTPFHHSSNCLHYRFNAINQTLNQTLDSNK